MKQIFKELGLVDRLIVFENSSSTIEYFKNLMDTLSENNEGNEAEVEDCYQPVSLLFLDINLPDKDSLKVAQQIKMQYKKLQEIEQYKKVQRPVICHNSSLNLQQIQSFMYDEEKADLYLNKPIDKKTVVMILKQLQVI